MKKRKKKKRKINITVLRRCVQAFFLLFILYGGGLGITKLVMDKDELISEDDIKASELNLNLQKDPRLNLYLPIRSCKNTDPNLGVFQGCGLLMLSENFTYMTFISYAIPILFLMTLILIFGRTWCGWACPMGFIQELLDWIRGKLKINYIKIPRKVNNILRKIRWGWLTTIFLIAFAIGLPIFSNIRKDLVAINCGTCPTRYVYGIFPGVTPTYMSWNTPFYFMSSVILLIFISLVILSFFVRRFWCRICPNGAFLALFNKGTLMRKEKDLQKCTKCGICYQVCPLDDEDVYEIKDRKVVNSKNCVMCFECVKKCPENDCLKVKLAGKTIYKSKFSKK